MLLATTGLLVAIGFAAWLIGEFFEYRGIGVIGAVLIIAVGAAITLTGLEYRSGVSKQFAYQTINNSTVVDNTTSTVRYRTTDVGEAFGATVLASLGIGGLLMLLGTMLLSQQLISEEVY
ncbi:hypothetical protein EI982_14595 [Haloplanus rallus]|uniref:Uncharacterized protein n=1 Tax=Haloplanus rallus TaxID=1816183 RepID=A0A6B9F5Z4_9EURY|nr:hypothetical protein [Haloplanus rallus]QGX95926.1 hypothetical protein EI982_14595 [Haloplanus rallus]